MKKYNINLLPSLKPFIERPFAEKLQQTDAIIERNLYEFRDDSVVSWSGGKDSTLVLWLIREVWPSINIVFNNTGVEYPETVRFVHELANDWKLNLVETKPIKTFWQCAEEYGFPGYKGKKQKVHCCYFLKEKPMLNAIRAHGWKAVFDGVTAVESRNRMFTASTKGTCYFVKQWRVKKVHPILYWTEDEVFEFFKSEGIPNNPLYSQGAGRIGCMTCTAWKYWEEQMSAENPKLYAIIKRRKDGQGVLGI